MLIAIHQPNFFPWEGYFGKIALVECFVFLDNVQLSRQSYTTRVQVRQGDVARWISAPVDRASHFKPIVQARIAPQPQEPWPGSLLNRLEAWYRGTPQARPVLAWLEAQLADSGDSLANLNVGIVRALAAELGLTPRFVRASELGVDGASTELLVAIARAVDATQYLRGAGAVAYQEDEKFKAAGVAPRSLRFRQEPYPQLGRGFVPGLSILDALFNCGFEQTAARIRGAASAQ